jgi:RimJ/RimL family protein N-acetyltransferase
MNRVSAGRLVLEPQIAAHAAEIFEVLSDPAIYEFENSPPTSLAALADRFAKLESRVSPDGEQQWLNWVIRLPTGALAGYVQATVARDRTAYIAYELASKFWRQGIGSAAVSAMLKELEATYGVYTCMATLKERNYRSRALLRSLGFERIGADDSDEIVMCKRVSGGTMEHRLSREDLAFRRAFEACQTAPADFDHAAHVRLAYSYLCENSLEESVQRMKSSLMAFLRHYGIGESKYHETLTRAWIMAVNHFMQQSSASADSAASFIASNSQLLDSKIMLTHYSAEVLFSAAARQAFVQPDIQSIPPNR